MSIIIGLTGPTGAGKSRVCSVCREYGFEVVNCDELARAAVQKNSEGLNALCRVFGEDILNEDGTLNRKLLAKRAFSCAENTELLNQTILPFIVTLVYNTAMGDRVLLDAPTLFESGLNRICKKTVAVLADSKIRLERILKRDNITAEDAKIRLKAGKSDDFYKKNADYIIYNNGKVDDFLNEFRKILEEILRNGD